LFSSEANHLGPALFTELLVDNLAQAQGAKVIHTSSAAYAAHNKGVLNFNALPVTRENFISSFEVYGLTKLLQIMYAKECQRVWADKGITSFSFHPGMVGTNFASESTSGRVFMTLASPIARTIDQGASTGLFCALSEDAMKFPGGFFDSNAHKELPVETLNPDACKQLREATLKWINLSESNEVKQ
jgi:NAD(P)-dependent dehydrogenase (short-subunit alcohol dehydrogenase family)